jgi:uncharacterized protein (TIGR02646 family)
MIQLNSKDLSDPTQKHLQKVQKRIDALPDFVNQASKAQSEWNSKSSTVAKAAAFTEIKEILISMCVGVEVCNYCENNEATDIEHIYPKSFFPERAFRWENYLLSCPTCNSRYKLDKFAIFDPVKMDTLLELLRGSGKPAHDDGVMINPRTENPLDYFWLDIENRTFILNPKLSLDSRGTKRAEYTLKLLGLNDRETLLAARKSAASYYIDRLERYVKVKEATTMQALEEIAPEPLLVNTALPFPEEKSRILSSLQNDIRQYSHPTVWQELKRQRAHLPKTNGFFTRAPEAMDW